MIQTGHNEGLKLARLLMVLSSVSPLFILWAIRGTALIPDVYFLTFCAAMVVGPNAFLWYRIRIARQRGDTRELAIAAVEDNREHLLVYLFAMLLPFYADTLATWRTLAAALAGLGFVVTPSQANFVWSQRADRPVKPLFEELKRRNILVRYMVYEGYADGLRISVGTDAEIDRLLEELRAMV